MCMERPTPICIRDPSCKSCISIFFEALIEIFQVRNPRRDTVLVTFKGENGVLVPIISCKEHDMSKRELYDLCEVDETGEVFI